MLLMGRLSRAFEAFVCLFTLRKSRYLTSGGLVHKIASASKIRADNVEGSCTELGHPRFFSDCGCVVPKECFGLWASLLTAIQMRTSVRRRGRQPENTNTATRLQHLLVLPPLHTCSGFLARQIYRKISNPTLRRCLFKDTNALNCASRSPVPQSSGLAHFLHMQRGPFLRRSDRYRT
jgi:hypothetical protein